MVSINVAVHVTACPMSEMIALLTILRRLSIFVGPQWTGYVLSTARETAAIPGEDLIAFE